MLKISEADALIGGGQRGNGLVIDLTDEGAPGLPEEGLAGSVLTEQGVGEPIGSASDCPVIAQPVRTISPTDRRAVGRFVAYVGHLLDAVAVGIPFLLSSFVSGGMVSRSVVALFVVVVTVLLWPTHRRDRHVIAPSEGILSLAGRVAIAPVVTWAILALVRMQHGIGGERMLDTVAILQIVVVTFPLILLGRIVSYHLWTRARQHGYDLEDTLILGSGPTGVEVAEALQGNPHVGLVPCGFVDRFETNTGDLPLVGHPHDLPAILDATGVHNVVIAFGGVPETELVGIVRRCRGIEVQFYMVPRLFELGVSAGDLGHEVDGLPLVKVTTPHQREMRAKRVFDLVLAAILCVFTAPLMIACALAVKLNSRGPVFFRQVRVGIDGRPFEILKFRSMKVNDDSNTQWSVDDDDRVTLVGKILRPSHLDELPQLFNVLRGDMSLVGPRPERPHFVEQFTAEVSGYEERHRVPVGITGWAQVNGYWGDSSIERRVRLDNRYIENWSIWRDLVIALRTIPTLLGRRR